MENYDNEGCSDPPSELVTRSFERASQSFTTDLAYEVTKSLSFDA